MASNWISAGNAPLGMPQPGIIYDTVQGLTVGARARFRDIGTTLLGEGEFIYLSGAANVDAGDVCTYSIAYNSSVATSAVVPWAGTANTASPLAVATAATVAGTFGWYQISGSAIVNSSGTVVAGNDLYWQAAGVVSATLVSGKQFMNAVAASANGVPATNQCIVTLDRPLTQGLATALPAGDITIPAGSHFTVGQATAAGSIPVDPFSQFGGYGGMSAPDWFGRGIQLDFPAQVYTDTTSSGAKNSVYGSNWGQFTIAFSSPTTVARAATLKINGPAEGANCTITHGYCINTSDGDNQFEDNSAFGSLSPSAKVHIGSDITAASWGSTDALNFLVGSNTLSDNSTTGGSTISQRAASCLKTPTFDFILGGSTITDAYSLLVSANPAAGSNATITNTWALGVLGNVKITGRTATSASTTARAGLNIPHGAAPTSPVDGDMWTTTAGLFVRINGSTVGPLS